MPSGWVVHWWPSPGLVLMSVFFAQSATRHTGIQRAMFQHGFLELGCSHGQATANAPKVQSCSVREVSGRTISASQPLSLMESWSKVAGTNADCWRPAPAAHAWELQLRGSRTKQSVPCPIDCPTRLAKKAKVHHHHHQWNAGPSLPRAVTTHQGLSSVL
ncbi:hypothetical protein X797_010530 [Metarhizium robertsii]|uniref:Uncharacterized protein n=1 Tax=Metarhizium robertsii TaxID=568076 RepID=A0A014N8T4_9HYPO|nr:hypothetical protein X797_010530 [Metarhizium robertsii]